MPANAPQTIPGLQSWAGFYGGNVSAPQQPPSVFGGQAGAPPAAGVPYSGAWTNPQTWANYYSGNFGFTAPQNAGTPAGALVDASSLWTYVDDLRRLAQNGELSFYSLPLPPLLGAKVSYLFNKISQQAAKIERIDNDPKLRARETPGQITTAVHNAWVTIDAAIRSTLDECAAVRNEIDLATIERDKIWAEAEHSP